MPATLTFSDDFNSLNLWNGSTGTWATNYWYSDPKGNGGSLPSNGEQQWYINSDYAPTASVKPWTVDDGVLTITAAPATPEISALINGYQYTSGELNTYHSFTQKYGYFEMRAELPAGQGVWPAFWLLPANGQWPPELDIFEVLGNEPDKLYTTVHTTETGTHTSSGIGTIVSDTSIGYHTYGMDWEADKITFFYDGKQVYQVDTPADMHQAMYMITNLAIGGYWPGNANATTPLPAQMNIDYVHVYSSMPDDAAAKAAAAAVSSNAAAVAAETAATGGIVRTANGNNASVLVGADGTDTLNAGHAADTMTGGAGADSFVFKHLPWASGHITDFTVGVDKLDLSHLLKTDQYNGTDPVADGYVILTSDGAGGTIVSYDADGRGSGTLWSTAVTTLDHVSPKGLTWAQLQGGGSTTTYDAVPVKPSAVAPTTPSAPSIPSAPASGSAGQTLTAADATPTVLVGGAGADTLTGGHNSDTLTGGAGADTFVFKVLPWNAGHVTDFTVGVDKLDLSALFKAAGYTGTDPVADGYLSFRDDGHGGAQVMFDTDGDGGGNPWPFTITTLDGVSPASLTAAKLLGATTAPAAVPMVAAPSTGAAGLTLTAADAVATTLVGGGGADTLTGGHNSDVMTGGAGADTFDFNVLPWNAGHITDFTPGVDKLDLTGVASAAGYHGGANAIADGYLAFRDDGHGGTQVYFDTDGPAPGNPWPFLITTLDHVAPSAIHAADWIV